MIEESTIIQSSEPNGFIITNKSTIEKKSTSTEEAQDIKNLHFLYQMTNQNFPAPKIKKDLNAFIENARSTINYFSSEFSGLGEKINTNLVSDNLLYKNKVASFNRGLKLFHNKMNFIKENNKKTNEIIRKVDSLMRECDLYIESDFDMNINDTILDIDQITLQYKYIKNFENLFNIEEKNFKIKDTSKDLLLSSNVFDYFNNYSLIFSLVIKTSSILLEFSNDKFDEIFLNDKNLAKYESENLKTNFMNCVKYLLYKFMKEEIEALRKYYSNSKVTSFEYKGLTFTWKKLPRKLSIKCLYFDNLEIHFSITKTIKKAKEKKNINSRKNPQIMEFFKIFCQNIAHDVKYIKVINNFIKNVKKAQNVTFDNLMKSSIFIKNLAKFGSSSLRHDLTELINKESKDLGILCTDFLTPNYHFAKYQLTFDFIDRGNKPSYIITLYFDLNLNLTINIKEPHLNHIYIFDNSYKYSVEKGQINFNMLFPILKNLVPLLSSHNYKDISMKIVSI